MYQKSKNRVRRDYLPKLFVALMLVLAVTIIAAAFKWLLSPAPFVGYISALDWRYDWQIEEWQAAQANCWGRGCIPVDGYDGRYEWRDTGRNRQTGQICTQSRVGKTTTTNCVPTYANVYDDYGTYTVNQWQVVHTVSNAGSGSVPVPSYPTEAQLDMYRVYGTEACPVDLMFVGRDAPGLGCKRAGQQIPHHWYTLTITSETTLPTNEYRCEVGYETFLDLRMEQSVRGTYRHRLRWFSCASVRLE
jgi:hypothetical protein